MANPHALPRFFDDPANFLHSIDVDGDQAIFFRTSPQLLRDASFVDGRIAIATAAPVPTSMSELVVSDRAVPMVDRYVFNCAFCGSTLLARLLDVPGRSLVLKEPRCLTDIAAWKVFSLRDGLSVDRLGPALKLARAALRRPFASGEAVTVKVASPGNILLDDLAKDASHISPIFITISRARFLRAIFRGGVERMHYAATLAWNMAVGEPDGDAMLKEALRAGADPLRKAANLAVLARFLQVGSFQRAARAGGWDAGNVIDFAMITKAPHEATVKAARILKLGIDDEDIGRNVARLASRYSKQPDATFSVAQECSSDQAVLAEHGQVFDDALAWAESALGPQRVITS